MMITEYNKFRNWETSNNPWYMKIGEWECDYEHWDQIYSAFDCWVELSPNNESEYDALLYLIARDNEGEIIADKLMNYLPLAKRLAESSLSTVHSNAKWQLARVIANIAGDDIDDLLFRLSLDRSYYVQRICMMESAKRKSKYAKEMIEWSWLTNEEYQMICAIWSLHWLDDNDLEYLLERALRSKYEYLVKAANQILTEKITD